jgi:Lrp/AsnC family transcriptional regulator, leucine-responsive regulatory protein
MALAYHLTTSRRQIEYKKKKARNLERNGELEQNPRFRNLDALDAAILCELQTDARKSFAEIGKAVALSATSVAERIRRLEHEGIIEGYQVKLSAAKLGYPVTAFILARPNGPDMRFINVTRQRPEILACYRVTGEFSFITHAVVRDVTHLEELLNHLEPATLHVVTLVVLSTSFDSIPMHVR